MNDPELRADLLAARDARAELLGAALGRNPGSVLMISANVPGPDKFRPGLARLLQNALDALHAAVGLEGLAILRDRAGPFRLAVSAAAPEAAKRASLALEAGPSGRLHQFPEIVTELG